MGKYYSEVMDRIYGPNKEIVSLMLEYSRQLSAKQIGAVYLRLWSENPKKARQLGRLARKTGDSKLEKGIEAGERTAEIIAVLRKEKRRIS